MCELHVCGYGVEVCDECLQILSWALENDENIIKKAEKAHGFMWTGLKCFLLPVSHKNVGVGRGKSFTHSGTLSLQVPPVPKHKVVTFQVKPKEKVDDVKGGSRTVWIPLKHVVDSLDTIFKGDISI